MLPTFKRRRVCHCCLIPRRILLRLISIFIITEPKEVGNSILYLFKQARIFYPPPEKSVLTVGFSAAHTWDAGRMPDVMVMTITSASAIAAIRLGLLLFIIFCLLFFMSLFLSFYTYSPDHMCPLLHFLRIHIPWLHYIMLSCIS